MIRALIIEFLLSGVIGAIVFRLSWAASKRNLMSWGVVLVVVAMTVIFIPGSIDGWHVQKYGAGFLTMPVPHPLVVQLLRSLGLIGGAWLASIVVARRKKRGFEEDRRFRDFP